MKVFDMGKHSESNKNHSWEDITVCPDSVVEMAKKLTEKPEVKQVTINGIPIKFIPAWSNGND